LNFPIVTFLYEKQLNKKLKMYIFVLILKYSQQEKKMFNNIEVLAGKKAIEIIKDGAFSEDKISVIAGAAGGPKFLALAGFDRLLLSRWFKKRKSPIFYIGSSIGAWRGAAFACKNPLKSYNTLVESYLSQSYSSKPSATEVTKESRRIMNEFLSTEDIDFALSKSIFHLNFIATHCKGLSASSNPKALSVAFIPSIAINILSRNLLLWIFTRTLFYNKRKLPPFAINFKEDHRIPLSDENFKEALLASGSIPFVMEGVKNIIGAPAGVYRDGGITDYHLNINFGTEELIFYPHFSKRITPGWLDKSLKWRNYDKNFFSNVIIIRPSEKFINSLKYKKIPDRSDFKTFLGNDKERLSFWRDTIKKSSILGEEFFEAAENGKLKSIIKEL